MTKAIFVLMAAGLGGCEVRECDPDTEDCSFEDSDADSDVDADSDTDTGDGTCDSANWDPAADDTCADGTHLETCSADAIVSVDCVVECEGQGAGTCDVHPTEGGFACVCGGGECDYETWDNAASDTCIDDANLRTCDVGDVFLTVDCVAECQDAVGEDGVCATLFDEPGYGCVCGSGDTCTAGTVDSCVDEFIVERCVNEIVITESCANWCQVEKGFTDGTCDPDSQTCECF